MIRELGNRHRVGLAAIALAVVVISSTLVIAAPKSGADKDAKSTDGGQPVVRLPRYFAGVVTVEQREKILTLQQEFAPQVRQKRAELQELLDKRDAALMKALKPEQRKEVERLRAAARAKRAADDDEETEMAEAAPAKTDKSDKPAKSDKEAKAEK